MCGSIRYVLLTEPIHSTTCHCSDCRHAIGSQSVAWVTVPLKHFVITQGDPETYCSSPKVHRTFCATCGTSLTYRHEEYSTGIDITTGSLDTPELFPPTKEIFCRDKLSWVKTTTNHVEN